uniref:uncharacterized protein LOC122596948 n=1 Tax=Erigeron canadensis TaxID=72917 RepID=UPI001CB94FA1|nr:uncharacterized protein LOC122596948 [Erigeron canadensis]
MAVEKNVPECNVEHHEHLNTTSSDPVTTEETNDTDKNSDADIGVNSHTKDEENKVDLKDDEPKISYAAKVQMSTEKKKANFRKLEAKEAREGVDIVIPRDYVREVNNRFQNTPVGYFLGKQLAFPVVKNFAKNNWMRFGISKVMMNANGFFFFKFNDKNGMNKVLEEGPWMIRSVPLLLNIWTPFMSLKKEEIRNITVWVKLHDVPMAAYTVDGLSLLATKLGNPRTLDTYINIM